MQRMKVNSILLKQKIVKIITTKQANNTSIEALVKQFGSFIMNCDLK